MGLREPVQLLLGEGGVKPGQVAGRLQVPHYHNLTGVPSNNQWMHEEKNVQTRQKKVLGRI